MNRSTRRRKSKGAHVDIPCTVPLLVRRDVSELGQRSWSNEQKTSEGVSGWKMKEPIDLLVRPAGIEPATLSLEDVPDDEETLEESQKGPNTGDTKGQEEDS